jgi:hypothetical protein
MQNSTKREVIITVSAVVLAIILIFAMPQPTGKVYNCSLAEISPDYPVKVKEECRTLRAENFNKNLHKPK